MRSSVLAVALGSSTIRTQPTRLPSHTKAERLSALSCRASEHLFQRGATALMLCIRGHAHSLWKPTWETDFDGIPPVSRHRTTDGQTRRSTIGLRTPDESLSHPRGLFRTANA